MSGLDAYAASFLDPFDGTITQPKIYDGSVTRSSGLKFRQTGNFTLDGAGLDNYIVLFPGLSNGLVFKKSGDVGWTLTSPYPTHLGTTTDRNNIRRARLVSQGLKLSLLNSSDDNEGYWEAIRVPIEWPNMQFEDIAAPIGEDYRIRPNAAFNLTNLSNYQTFQTGRLRDLHRFLFKLNSVAPDHTFTEITGAGVEPSARIAGDGWFDMIFIRLVGRIDAVTPSMIQYDHVSNIEVVYKDDTVMARLATMNTMVPNINVLLDRTRFILPAIQIA